MDAPINSKTKKEMRNANGISKFSNRSSMEEPGTTLHDATNGCGGGVDGRLTGHFKGEWSSQRQLHPKEAAKQYGEVWWTTGLVFVAVLLSAAHLADNHLPEPRAEAGRSEGVFVEEAARRHLKVVTDLGPRVTGGDANEIHAANYILGEIQRIAGEASAAHLLEAEVQKPSGSFSIGFLWGFTSVYQRVKNVLVKLSPAPDPRAPAEPGRDALLINCHFDSVADSPGASDDAVSCAIMLEVLNVISKQPTPFNHSIIFNFNGAEENILQASHGFITQHRWAKSIKAFINLESAGAGGKELVFQTGPAHRWLIQLYSSAAPYPYGNSIAQEVFQSGIIPGDTDFRIYRDYGRIPGIDIAYIANGYVYHTKWDIPENIPAGCIQRAGDNVLGVVRAMADSPYLSEPGHYRHGSMVFFDVLGLFMLSYPSSLAPVINTLTLGAVMYRLVRRYSGKETTALTGAPYAKLVGATLITSIVSHVVSILASVSVGVFLTSIGHALSWFSNTMLTVPLFVFPSILMAVHLHTLAKNRFVKYNVDRAKLEAAAFDASLLEWTLWLGLMTACNLLSAFIPLMWSLVPLVVRDMVEKSMRKAYHSGDRKYLLYYFAPLIIPGLLSCYLAYGSLAMFIPMSGRIGTEIMPDVGVGILISFTASFGYIYLGGLTYVVRSTTKFRLALLSGILVTLLAIVSTDIGFPYKDDVRKPAYQRHYIQHIDRHFHTLTPIPNGGWRDEVVTSDSGIWHIPFDHVGIERILDTIPALSGPGVVRPDCDAHLFCDMPYYFPMARSMRRTYYIPGPAVNPSVPLKMTLLDKTVRGNITTFQFMVTGPHHMGCFLSPREGVTMPHWSLADGHPLENVAWGLRQTYFVFYSHAELPADPWVFDVDFEVPDDYPRSEPIVDVAFTSHYKHGPDHLTPHLVRYMEQFPNWANPVGWAGGFHKWEL